MTCQECRDYSDVRRCDKRGCGIAECTNCFSGRYCDESDTYVCESCWREEQAYWRASYEAERRARLDLGLPLEASDDEVLKAAWRLK